MEKLEPDTWDFRRDGLYMDWLPRQKFEKYCIDKALKKVEEKLRGEDARNRKKTRTGKKG